MPSSAFFFTFPQADTFRKRTLTLGPRGVRLREVRLVFHIFHILEYSVYSAIPFCQSVSAPFLQIWSPLCLPIFRNVTEIVKNMVWGDAVPKLQTFVWIFNHASSPRGFKNHNLIPVQPQSTRLEQTTDLNIQPAKTSETSVSPGSSPLVGTFRAKRLQRRRARRNYVFAVMSVK